MRVTDLDAFNRTQINRAGARYTPGIDPTAPNIEIRELALALAVIGDQDESRMRLRELESAVREGIRWKPKIVVQAFRGKRFTPECVADALRHLAASKPEGRMDHAKGLQRSVRRARATLTRIQNSLYEQERIADTEKVRRSVAEMLWDVRRVLSPISEVAAFVGSPPFELLTTNRMLLLGVGNRQNALTLRLNGTAHAEGLTHAPMPSA